MDIADLRQTYRRATLDESHLDIDPFLQFGRWLDEAIAAKVIEPTAMTLATVDANGNPSARVVLLKGLDRVTAPSHASGRGFVWYTNYESRKGHALAADDAAALCFFWPELERQVRIEGHVEKTSDAESDRYFASRPLASRIGARASPQSEVVASRQVIEDLEAAEYTRLGLARDATDAVVARPPQWGGYRLVPDRIEFWQGRPSRMHDRLVYEQRDSDWIVTRLAP
jgi:pyridoxamine 5'-phosphate oxidase